MEHYSECNNTPRGKYKEILHFEPGSPHEFSLSQPWIHLGVMIFYFSQMQNIHFISIATKTYQILHQKKVDFFGS